MCFVKFLFHLSEVAVSIDFAREKKMFFTGFTHLNLSLWKSCELGLEQWWFAKHSIRRIKWFKIGDISTEKPDSIYIP